MAKTYKMDTPWEVESDTDILDKDGAFVATTHYPGASVGTQREYDTADYIVRAVNSHAALVEALELMFEHCAMTHNVWGDGCNIKEANEAVAKGRAALKLAKGA